MKPREKALFYVILFALGIFPSGSSAKQIHAGISAGAAVGVFVAQDEDFYMGIDTDLYPELGLYLDVSAIQFGLTAGLIYRKREEWGWGWDWEYEYERTIFLIPTQLDIRISPAKLIASEPFISPFVALGIGAFIPAGSSDYDKIQAAFTAKVGLEIPLEYIVPCIDLRYTYCRDSDTDAELGGFIATVGAALRLPLK